MKLLISRTNNRPIYNLDLPRYEVEGFGNTYYTNVYTIEDLQAVQNEFTELVTFSFEELDNEEIVMWGIVED